MSFTWTVDSLSNSSPWCCICGPPGAGMGGVLGLRLVMDRDRRRLAAAKLPAGGVDRVPLALAEFHVDSGVQQDVAEAVHRVARRRLVGQSRDGIIGNHIQQGHPPA